MRTLPLFLLTCALVLNGCVRYPDQEELMSKPAIYTERDKDAVFTSYKTFYVSDTIALLDDQSDDTIMTGVDVQSVVNTVKQNLTARGYKFVAPGAKPDLGINLVLVKNITLVSYYYPGYWTYYPGWYSWYYPVYPYYPYYPYYYPYPVTIPYNTGTLIVDMVDLKNIETNKKYVVIWNSVMTQLLSSTNINVQNAIAAVNQAFIQSPYLQTN